jgi:hypothetical protein
MCLPAGALRVPRILPWRLVDCSLHQACLVAWKLRRMSSAGARNTFSRGLRGQRAPLSRMGLALLLRKDSAAICCHTTREGERTYWHTPPGEEVFMHRDFAWGGKDLWMRQLRESFLSPKLPGGGVNNTSHDIASPATAVIPLSQSHSNTSMQASTPACFGTSWVA